MTNFYFEMSTSGLINVAPFADEWGDFSFKFPICSASDTNDGVLPYGTKIDTVVVKAYEGDINNSVDIPDATEVIDLIEANPIVSGKDIVLMKFQWPATFTGDATLYFEVTLDSGAKQGFLFRKIIVG